MNRVRTFRISYAVGRCFSVVIAVAVLAGCARSHPLTFTRDIAPIVLEHCSPCHRPGQMGPFSLLSYDDVKARAPQIAAVTARRRMPPWLPERGYGRFSNERRLRDDQIELIGRWVEQGALEGDRDDTPVVPPPMHGDGWQMGQPDLVVSMPQPYTFGPGHHDVFRNFVIPIAVPSTRYVRAVEFRPGTRRVVHHAVIGIDRTRLARRLDEQDPEPGYGDRLSEGVQAPDGHFVGWTPGKVPFAQPPDMAWRLDRGTDLVVQLHLLPSDRQESIQSQVGLWFADAPPTRLPVLIKLGSKTIDIPAGEAAYTVTDTYMLPADVDVLTVYPHAHYLAKDMKGYATLPDGTTKWLIWIKDWDYNWQDEYRYTEPVSLPKGSTVTMRYTYDNSAANERNPHRPPAHVMYGPHSSDEMGDLLFQILPRNSADAAVIARDQRDREARANIARGETMLARDPSDAEARNWLAAGYLTAGRIDEAIPHLMEAIRLRPAYAEAHYNLGGARQAQGRLKDAAHEFREAVRLRPGDDRAHLKLANVLNSSGSRAEAIQHYERTLAIDPESAEAHNNLGVALGSEGKLEEAIAHFRQALSIRPDYAEVHNNLGVMLGSPRQAEEAAAHFRRALEIRPDNPDAQRNLDALVERQRASGLKR